MNVLFSLADIDKTQELPSLLDKLLYGGEILLIGLGTVFAVLILLWITLVAFKYVFKNFSGSKTGEETAPEAVVQQAIVTSQQNEEIVAAIAAAIAMAESESSSGLKFKVVSFRRK